MYGAVLPLTIYVIQKFSDSILNRVINSGDRALWLEHLRTGAQQINSVKEMVTYVQNQCAEKERQVATLVISGHGNPTGFRIGNNDFITLQNLSNYKDDLSKLAPLFMERGGVYIEACETGQNSQLLREFSKVLGGVYVTARKTEQSSWVPSGPSTTERQD